MVAIFGGVQLLRPHTPTEQKCIIKKRDMNAVMCVCGWWWYVWVSGELRNAITNMQLIS